MPTPSPVFRKKPSLARQVFDGEGGWLRVFHAPLAPGWESCEASEAKEGVRVLRASYVFAEGPRALNLSGRDELGGEVSLEQLASGWMVEHAGFFGPRPKTTITHAVQRLIEGDVPALEVLVEGAPARGERFRLRGRYALRGAHRLTLCAAGPVALFDQLSADVENWFDSAAFDPR